MKKIVLLLICSLPLLILAACGGGGDPAPGSSGAAPTVVSITPANGAMGVSATTAIKVTFSDVMKPPTVSTALNPTTGLPNGNFTVSFTNMTTTIDPITNTSVQIEKKHVVAGTLAPDSTASKIFTFTPAYPLTATDSLGNPTHATRTYEVRINGGVNGQNGVQSAGGTMMLFDFASTFSIWAGTQEAGTLENDVVSGVGADGDGNSYLAGYTYGSMGAGANPDGSGGTSDILVAKYDANGVLAWTQQLASQTPTGQLGSYDDKILGAVVDSSSGSPQLVAAGYTDGTLNQASQASPVQVNPDASGATHNYCAVKYDVNGNLVWAAQAGPGPAGSSVSSIARAVATDVHGNVYVVGETYGNLRSQTTFTTNYQAGADVFVAKYSAGGSLQWTTLLGTTSDDVANGVAVDANGNTYVAGWTSGSLFGANQGGKDIFVAKLDTNGNLIPAASYQTGTTRDDFASAVTVDSTGSVLVTGGTFGSLFGTNGGPDPLGNITSDLFVIKLSTAGAVVWTQQLGTQYNDAALGVVTDAIGNVFVTGYTFGGLDGNLSSGGADIFLVKYSSAGIKQWTKQLGATTANPPQIDAVSVGMGIGYSNGSIYLGGYTFGNLDSNFNMDGTFNTSDFFLVKYDSTFGLKY